MILSNVKSFLIVALAVVSSTHGFSITNMESSQKATSSAIGGSRRELFKHVASAGALSFVAAQPMVSNAAPTIYNLPSGIKYAVTKDARGQQPQKGDIVAVEYTGYLTNGQIFDATHSEGKSNALLFKAGLGSVIPGLDEMVLNMEVGQKVQAIIPASLAYGDKGVCIENGECLIKPGSTLVYDVLLKKCSIPPP